MNPLLLLGLGLFLFVRLKKTTTTTTTPSGAGVSPPGGSGTPQGQVVILTNNVVRGDFPCMDPDGKRRVFVIREMQKEMNDLKQQIDNEDARSQPDEAYIAQLSAQYNAVWNAMKAASVDHADKCKKYAEDFVRRQSTPVTGLPITTAPERARRQV